MTYDIWHLVQPWTQSTRVRAMEINYIAGSFGQTDRQRPSCSLKAWQICTGCAGKIVANGGGSDSKTREHDFHFCTGFDQGLKLSWPESLPSLNSHFAQGAARGPALGTGSGDFGGGEGADRYTVFVPIIEARAAPAGAA